uniref:G-protein coupled receptors family 1 profile domain-containing protein n=1 Tax=Panagrolaimus sp. ES5 TaxID=591445 RepID=A0AC34G4L9_9BILA
MGIWLFPILIWAPIFFLFLESDNFGNDGCLMSRNRAHIIPIIAIPILYVPAMILIAMFVRISLVVHRHLKFLREHSSVPQLNSNSPLQERTALSVNSINRDCNSSLRAPEQKRNTFESLTTVTSGYCTTTLRTPRSNSPWFPRSTEFQLAPLSEEKSSGRERSQSEQINLTPEVQNSLKIADSRSHSKIDTSSSVPTRRESIVAKQLLLMQRAEAFFHRKPSAESVGRLARATSCRSRYSSSDSTGSSIGGPVKIFRKFSNLSRASSKRFSVIAIHSNLTDLLLREGVSHQVKAAKAVALITCCFLCCWFPFLIVWPIKIYCHTCVPEQFYRWCVWLNYLCSAINPILYTLSSPRVRSALKKYASFASYRSKMRMKAASFYKSNTLV